jgi:hypothetical protein
MTLDRFKIDKIISWNSLFWGMIFAGIALKLATHPNLSFPNYGTILMLVGMACLGIFHEEKKEKIEE